MTLIAIALFGLLFVAIFGAKAARGVLKIIGALAVIVVLMFGVAFIKAETHTASSYGVTASTPTQAAQQQQPAECNDPEYPRTSPNGLSRYELRLYLGCDLAPHGAPARGP